MWFLLWAVLLVAGLALLGLLGYGVVRKGLAVLHELEDVSARLAEVSEHARVATQGRLAAQPESERAEPGRAEPGRAEAGPNGTIDRAPLTSRAGLR